MINKTFQLSVKHARTIVSSMMKKNYRSPFPALNIRRRSKPAVTDTVYCDAPAIDECSTCTQLLVGTKTLITDVYGIRSDEQFANSLEDEIRHMGAMDKLMSDSA